jgi:murein L,D-transpeptidase YafK
MSNYSAFRLIILVIFSLGASVVVGQTNFITQQKRFNRVNTAYIEKNDLIKETLDKQDISIDKLNIIIIAFKEEQVLEIFAKENNGSSYSLITEYPICASSGQLGPKRMSGDGQVPEGFYHINRFNPSSSFYLSLGLNYPNDSDLRKSTATDPGSDIFIHGSCVTIGCLPMTDDYIKEIYLYAAYARQAGQRKIPVYVFPFKMNDENMQKHVMQNMENTLLNFWRNLKSGYDLFFSGKKKLNIRVDREGHYLFL